MEKVTLAVVVQLQKLSGVLADLQVDGASIDSVTPVVLKGITQALVVFELPLDAGMDPYDALVMIEMEYKDKVTIY